jgi:hypothetical protein
LDQRLLTRREQPAVQMSISHRLADRLVRQRGVLGVQLELPLSGPRLAVLLLGRAVDLHGDRAAPLLGHGVLRRSLLHLKLARLLVLVVLLVLLLELEPLGGRERRHR